MTHTTNKNDDTVNHSRRRFFGFVASGVAAVAMTSVMSMDANASGRITTMIKHPDTGNWIEYTPRRAAKYYKTHGQVPAEFRRQLVDFRTREKPGTIIVDGNKHFLFFVMGNGKAMRYGIGVGREERERKENCIGEKPQNQSTGNHQRKDKTEEKVVLELDCQ